MISINLDHQSLTSESAEQIIHHLKEQEIDQLSLFSNHLGDIGISLVVPALITTKIRRISLAYNSIKNKGATHLSRLIEQNQTIKYLDLDENLIEQDGITQLLNKLEYNHNLVNLSLAGNPGLTIVNNERLKFLLNRNRTKWKARNKRMGEIVDVGRKLIVLSISPEIKMEILKRMYPNDFTQKELVSVLVILDKIRLGQLNKGDRFEADVLLRECIYLRLNAFKAADAGILKKQHVRVGTNESGLFKSCARLISKGNNFVFSSLNLEMKDDFNLQRAIYSPVEAVGSVLSGSVGAVGNALCSTYKNWNNEFTRFFTDDGDSDLELEGDLNKNLRLLAL
jgi:hypothetical protein